MRTRVADMVCLGLCLAAIPMALYGQEVVEEFPYSSLGTPLPSVADAPFSATATITVTDHRKNLRDQDPTRTWDTFVTRLYRDTAGRIRIEYDMPDDRSTARRGARRPMYWVLPAADGKIYRIDPEAHTATFTGMAGVEWGFNAAKGVTVPIVGFGHHVLHMNEGMHRDGHVESLGSRQIEGLRTIGWRIDDVVRKRLLEQWASPELRLIVQSRYVEEGLDVEYRLTGVSRSEPPSRLFALPAGYMTIEPPTTER